MFKVLLFSSVSLMLGGVSSYAVLEEYTDVTSSPTPYNSLRQIKGHYYTTDNPRAERPWMNELIKYKVIKKYDAPETEMSKGYVLYPEEAADIIPPILSDKFKREMPFPEGFFESIFFTPQEIIQREIKGIIEYEEKQEKTQSLLPAAAFFSEQEKLEMFEIAKAVKNTLAPENTLIVLGQSPAYVATILEFLDVPLIHIPMSGIPDFIEAVRCNGQAGMSNLVTPQKQQFFRELLKERGYDPSELKKDHKAFILDLKNSGRGVSAFVRQIVQWHQEMGTPMPDLNYISLNASREPFTCASSLTSQKSLYGIFNRPSADMSRVPNLKSAEFNFIIDEYPISISSGLHKKFDTVPDNARLVPSFEARYWVPASKELMAIYPRPYAREIADDLLMTVRTLHIQKETSTKS